MLFNNPNSDTAKEYAEAVLLLAEKQGESQSLAGAREKAVRDTLDGVKKYRDEGMRDNLIHSVFKKRMELIKKVNTVKELKQIMIDPKPHYNGSGFVTSDYSVPEEELILWSITSLWGGGPLNEPAFKRYIALFQQVFGVDPSDPSADLSELKKCKVRTVCLDKEKEGQELPPEGIRNIGLYQSVVLKVISRG